ncbi:phosphoribosyltransferase [Streptomyces sp. MUM 203J]|uniref:phosphoribosyltransferase n=1 Tax=Streptomyces sp. MUM 203J TaxID=2791990 RepID=UPI001F04187A|nr:phosphoribosyltransferase family protein [Streptomyces sp. MUM 203J]MCH0538910.1 phosphoribosyltransferase [Streptomyces sp. MUM 203J]
MEEVRFEDRRDAGRRLAARLREAATGEEWFDPVVLALPRGGVPVGAEVARALHAPLDVLVTRKIGLPGQPEVGIGAIAGEAPPVYDDQVMRMLGILPDELGASVAHERTELHRLQDLYRGHRPGPDLRGRTVLLVDDGLATGVTARAALRLVRAGEPARLVLALPVADRQALAELRPEADALVCLSEPADFQAVGRWYGSYEPVSDDEVIALLRELSDPSLLRPARHR